MSFFGDLYDATVGQVVGPNSITGKVYDTVTSSPAAKLALGAAAVYFLGPSVAAALGENATAAEIAAAAGVDEAAVTNAAATAASAAEAAPGATAGEIAANAFPDYGTATGVGAAGSTLGDAAITGTAAAGAASPALLSQLGDLAKTYGVPLALLTSGLTGASAAKSAAQTQADALAQANQLAYKIYGEQKALQEPFRQAGIGAQNQLLTYLGLPGGTPGADFGKYAKDFGMAQFQADPGYAFRLSEGQKALEQSAAARGGLLSGTTGKNLLRYGQEMGSQEYTNAFNRYQAERAARLNPLGSLLASGQSAAANQGTAAGQYGATAGSNLASTGAAQAAGTVGGVNALTGALGSYLNYAGSQNLADAVRQSAYRNALI
jgi:hypothetical protein